MPVKNSVPTITEEVAEVFRVSMCTSQVRTFLAGQKCIHSFLATIDGYRSTDVLLLSDSELMVVVRWVDAGQFEASLPAILNGIGMKEWLKNAESITHQPAIVTTFTARPAHSSTNNNIT